MLQSYAKISLGNVQTQCLNALQSFAHPTLPYYLVTMSYVNCYWWSRVLQRREGAVHLPLIAVFWAIWQERNILVFEGEGEVRGRCVEPNFFTLGLGFFALVLVEASLLIFSDWVGRGWLLKVYFWGGWSDLSLMVTSIGVSIHVYVYMGSIAYHP